MVLLTVLFLAACTGKQERMSAKISKLEQSLVDSVSRTFDKNKAVALIKLYDAYAGSYPGDTLSAQYLFKMSELQTHAETPQAAIQTLDRIIREYPDFRRTPECMFLKGFIYDNNLADFEKAKVCYMEFIRSHPEHYFADDAQVLLDNLGKSPEELIRQFEEKGQ